MVNVVPIAIRMTSSILDHTMHTDQVEQVLMRRRLHPPPNFVVLPVPEVLHAVFGEVYIETVEESSQQTSHCPHDNED